MADPFGPEQGTPKAEVGNEFPILFQLPAFEARSWVNMTER
jgi:hypothetical protein